MDLPRLFLLAHAELRSQTRARNTFRKSDHSPNWCVKRGRADFVPPAGTFAQKGRSVRKVQGYPCNPRPVSCTAYTSYEGDVNHVVVDQNCPASAVPAPLCAGRFRLAIERRRSG